MPGLARLNALPDSDAVEVLLGCCSAPGWAQRVAGRRPFGSVDDLLAAAEAAWAAREPGELEAAMAGHPTGRGPDEILAELRRRMKHDPATELEVAAAEIGKINVLRLRQLAAA
jgi:2-oxo-4-hydroxy-4-carboxy-5-ureidoimidazoline decarboxylase